MNKSAMQRKIFQIMVKAPPICLELSPIDIYYICKGLIFWLNRFPNTNSVKKLLKKMRASLTIKFPKLTKEIICLLPD